MKVQKMSVKKWTGGKIECRNKQFNGERFGFSIKLGWAKINRDISTELESQIKNADGYTLHLPERKTAEKKVDEAAKDIKPLVEKKK